jgi:membrane-bound lytic murein transglycosylase D
MKNKGICYCALIAGLVFMLSPMGWLEAQDRPLRARQTEFPPVDDTRQPPALHYPLLTADALEQELTQHYIQRYSAPAGLAWLNASLKQGSIYIPFIQEEIRARNLPPELLYLPIIESGYLPGARSSSGAVGLWQFMMNSIGGYDMKVSDLIDERRDFIKSTRGALQKLQSNYRALGDWPLALAAYNAGLGAVNRVVQKTGSRDYWRLCEQKPFRSETIHYVPKLIAAAWVLSQPRRFGIDFWPDNPQWQTIPVGRQVSLEIIAAEAGVDRELLRRGNMELLYGLTPPDSSYRLKVPAAHAPLLAETIGRGDLILIRHYRYVIKYGDTLSALARHYGVSLRLIEQANPGIADRHLRIGETITIPALGDVEPYQGKAPGGPAQAAAPPFTGIHLVKKGETLWSIARAYSIDPAQLALANGIELNQTLREGKVLKVPIIKTE